MKKNTILTIKSKDMLLLDYFAAVALPLFIKPDAVNPEELEDSARDAYRQAVFMMVARKEALEDNYSI